MQEASEDKKMKVKRDQSVACRVSSDLLAAIEKEAERQHRTIAGLIHSLLMEAYGNQEPRGKEA